MVAELKRRQTVGKRDRERYRRTGKVFRDGKLVPQEKVDKKTPTPSVSPEKAIVEVMQEAGVPRISISDRIAKMKKDLEV